MINKEIASVAAKVATLRALKISPMNVEKCNTFQHQTIAAPYDYKLCFRNGIGRNVYVIHRNGFVVDIPHLERKLIDTDTLSISSCHISNAFVNLDVTSILDAPHATEQVRAMSKGTPRRQVSDQYGDFDSHYSVFDIDKEVLLEKGSVYIEELSLVVTIEDPHTIIHPDSNVARSLRKNRFDPMKQGAFDIEIVDPDHTIGLKWLRWLDTAFAVEPLRDDPRSPGIYATTREGNKVICKQYVLEDAEKLQLFDSMDEALQYDLVGELKKQHDIAVQELALKTTVSKGGNIQKERKLSKIAAKLKVKLLKSEKQFKIQTDKLLKEKTKREEKTAKLKDDFDRRSSKRKDTSEGIKVVGMVLGGLAAVCVVIKSIFF